MRARDGGVMRGEEPLFQLPLFLLEASAELVQPLLGAVDR